MFSFERTGKGRFGFGFRIRISDSFLKDSIIFTSDSIRYDSHSIWTWFGLSMHRYRVQHCKAMKPQGGLGHDGRNFASQTFGFLLSLNKKKLHTSIVLFIYLFTYAWFMCPTPKNDMTAMSPVNEKHLICKCNLEEQGKDATSSKFGRRCMLQTQSCVFR